MPKERLKYVENLRVGLMILVILQHAVRAYGSQVWWFVKDAPALGLERFTAVNSSFFMSLFFLISFYFLPASYERKGFWKFHRDRLLRLGFPLAAYTLLLSSALMYAHFSLYRGYGPISFMKYFADYFLGFAERPADWTGPSWPDLNLGHLWFVEHLLVYGLLYSIYRVAVGVRRRPEASPLERRVLPFPRNATIIGYAAIMGGVAFAVRLAYPLYSWTSLFGFLQAEPAHLPFYLGMAAAGILAARNDWFSALPARTGRLWLGLGACSAAAVAFLSADARCYGGPSPLAFAYAFFESFSCVGLVIGLLSASKRFLDRQGKFMRMMAENSYMIYIIHLPIVAAFQYALLPLAIDPYVKFLIVSAVSIPVTVLASWMLRKIPFLRKYV